MEHLSPGMSPAYRDFLQHLVTTEGRSFGTASLFLGVPLPTFTPPSVEEGIANATGLWRYFRHRQGISIGVVGSTVTQVRFPYQDDIAAYDKLYMGGYSHTITSAEATVLTTAGYGAYIT